MTTASKITLVRVFMIPLVMIAMYLSKGVSGLWMWISLGLFVIASVTDFIDGQIARKCNQVSDKLLTIAVMTVFCEWGRFPAWALMIVLTREFAVTGLRLVAVGKGTVIAAGWSGKVKTASTMIGLCAVLVFPQNATLLWVVTAVIVVTTVYSGVEYFIKNWNCLWD